MPQPEYISAEELRALEDRRLRMLYGYDNARIRSMTDAERASNPDIQELRGIYAVRPVSEDTRATSPSVYKEEKAKQGAYQGELLDLTTRTEEVQTVPQTTELLDYKSAWDTRNVSTSAYDPTRYYTTAIPVEQTTSYKPSGAPTELYDILGRQVSVPAEAGTTKPAGALTGYPDSFSGDEILKLTQGTDITESMKAGKAQQFWDNVSKQSMQDLRIYLGTKDSTFNDLPLDEQRKRMYSVVAGINYAPSIKEAEESDSTWFPVPRNVEGGNVPDYTEEQMAYLQAYRTNALKQKAASNEANGLTAVAARAQATDYVNNAIGKPEWWTNASLKQQRLSGAPEFQGVLGIGTYQYPAGATVESTPAYALRMLMAPANLVSGMIGGSLGASDSDIARARAESEITPTIVENDPTLSTWDRAVRAGLDNVKRNRGATEEIYDISVDAFNITDPTAKKALFGAALLTDVVLVPIVPGAGLVSGTFKAGAEASKVAGIAGKTVKVGDYLWEIAKTGLKETTIGSTGLWTAEKLGLLAAPNDIRFIAATGLAEAAMRGEAAIKALPAGLRTNIDQITTLISDIESKGISAIIDNSTYAMKDVARWTQAAIRAYPELADIAKASTKLPDIIATVAKESNGLKALRSAAISEAALDYVVRASKDARAGTLYLLTARTAIPNAKVANAIIDVAKKSKIGLALEEIATKGKVATKGTEGEFKAAGDVLDETEAGLRPGLTRGIGEGSASTVGENLVSWITVPDKAGATIISYLRSHRALNESEQALYNSIISNLSDANHMITTRQFNALQEIIIDDTARALFPTRSMSERAMSLMDKTARDELVKSIPLRDGMLYSIGRKYVSELSRPTKGLDIHPIFQNTINQIQQTITSMPASLRTKLKEIQTNSDIAKMYGLDQLPANAQEAFATLLFKSKGALREGIEYQATMAHYIDNTLIPSLKNLVFKSKTVRPVGDYFKSFIVGTDEELKVLSISDAVNRQIDEVTDALSTALMSTLMKGTPEAHLQGITIIKQYLNDIAVITKGTDIGVLRADRIEELLVSLYYDIESKDIIQKSIAETLHLQGKTESTIGDIQHVARKFYGVADTHVEPLWNAINLNINRMIISRAIGLMDDAARLTHTNPLVHLQNINLGDAAWQAAKDSYAGRLKGLEDGLRAGNSDAWLLLESIDDAAMTMLENYRLLHKDLSGALDELDRALQASSKAEADVASASTDATIKMGTTTVQMKQLTDLLQSIGGSAFTTEKLKAALHANPGLFSQYVDKIMTGIKNLQYFCMLTIRTRFHGVNIVTAPFIMASTIGAKDTIKAMPSILDGSYVSARLTSPALDISLLAKDNQIAFRTATGKAYTWKDIVTIARRGGITKTEGGFTNYQSAIDDAMEMVNKGIGNNIKNIPSNIYKVTKESLLAIAPFFDTSYRASVLISSLKAGETEMTAINKAREALYDYGKLTAWEQRNIANWFAFYSFTRASLGNALWNLLNNPSRIANQIKLSKGFRGQGLDADGDKNSLFYEPEYMQGRFLLESHKGVDKEAYKTYLPMLPLIDSYLLLAKVLNSAAGLVTGTEREWSVGDYAMERSNPSIQAVFAKRLQETYSKGYINPAHVSMLKRTGLWDEFKAHIGEPDERKARPGETVWGYDKNGEPYTYTYEEKPDASKRYINLLRVISVLGGDQWIKDYAPLVGATPEKAGIEMQTSLGEQLGFFTDVRTQLPIEVVQNKNRESASKNQSLKPEK